MAKYDGLIIPRSYSDYLNKTDGATLSQMLDSIGGTFDASPTPNSVKPARSGGIFAANAVIMANNKTLSGVAISAGSVVRVLFTAALTGSDATTGLTLTYNGNTYAVKVGKNGALANFLANNIDGSYIYCQAYTTLELMFDGSQFIIMGNPVVISSADYTIYTDGYSIIKDITIPNYVHTDTSYTIDNDHVHQIINTLVPGLKTGLNIVNVYTRNETHKHLIGFINKVNNIYYSFILNCYYLDTNLIGGTLVGCLNNGVWVDNLRT